MQLPESFLLLQQEGYLIRTSLAQGLTLLRSADIGEKGQYYGAFFGLSTGLERLLKVIIILDHMASHDSPPPRASLRGYGHDLKELFASARKIRSKRSTHPIDTIAAGSIEEDIVNHLNDFAEACGRYANLDALTSGRPQADPLGNWKRILQRILDQDVSFRIKDKARREAAALGIAVEGAVKAVAHDLDRRPLSLNQWLEVPRMYELASGRAVIRTFAVLCPVKALLEETNERVGESAPFMHEFLDFISDEPLNLRKRRWP